MQGKYVCCVGTNYVQPPYPRVTRPFLMLHRQGAERRREHQS